MLKESEFLVLNDLRQAGETGAATTQRHIAERTGLSLGTVNSTVKLLQDRSYLHDGQISASGLRALQPYKVDNAIIMAAGLSSRFVPLSYEKPKGTLKVRGEVLIERIIRQLQEAGINDITVVVGYMKEQFLYLEDAFNVQIVINDAYLERNNNSSLMLVKEHFANTYILAADYYFERNIFSPYVYQAYYAAIFVEGPTDEWVLRTGSGDHIVKTFIGGSDEWIMYGEAYFDKAYSRRFAEILTEVYDRPETRPKLWEEIYADHIKELDMVIRRYPAGVLHEFDSLADVRAFDSGFLANIDSAILDNICAVLQCQREQITDIAPIPEGLSNFSFFFRVGEGGYVYRHPGAATQGILNRAVEAEVEGIAAELGLDATFIYQDAEKGWKISRFVEVTEPFDYHNQQHVQTALAMVCKLHNSGKSVESNFDLQEETNKIKQRLLGTSQLDFPDFQELDQRAARLYAHVQAEGVPLCLCHNDFYEPNILIANEDFYLIDWEYTGMSDYASDLGTFICCSDYTQEQATEVLETYFGRPLTQAELLHCLIYVSLAGYYWFIWALNKEAAGESVGEWLHLWYRYAKEYGIIAEQML
ncbi:MAG: phosphotransferase [Coriobacteriales bacterium]|jgi:CTP:phosphocholine cytidylyltransferase-like protein/thiamine kinase-like enzyme|nr:phosphotransferase [Coriobacteriales bacterium]